ncbi:hypothetical protein [Nonomuraea sp. B1E8]
MTSSKHLRKKVAITVMRAARAANRIGRQHHLDALRPWHATP